MKYKVGDRVAVYGTVPCELNKYSNAYKRGAKATVTNVHADDEIEVETIYGKTVCHPKQCRRLKKKERRRVWVFPPHLESDSPHMVAANGPVYSDEGAWIEFVEVKKRKE